MLLAMIDRMAGRTPELEIESITETQDKNAPDTSDAATPAEQNETGQDAPAPQPPVTPVAVPDVMAPPSKPAQPTNNKVAQKTPTKRKTKYSANKAAVAELLKPADAAFPVREIRAFLLSLPEYKPQDMALMSDTDVMDIFSKNYIAVNLGSGMIIMTPTCCAAMSDLLVSREACCIPSIIPAKQENP